jgi:hypothetical protein
MNFHNLPAPKCQPCCMCGKQRQVSSYYGGNPTKPVCVKCEETLVKIQRIIGAGAKVEIK